MCTIVLLANYADVPRLFSADVLKLEVTIKTVDVFAGRVTLERNKTVREFSISRNVKISIDGKTAKLDQLKSDMTATILFDRDSNSITSVAIKSAEPGDSNLNELNGNWLTVAEEFNGQKLTPSEVRGTNRLLHISDETFKMSRVWKGKFGEYNGQITLDSTQDPKHFDFMGTGPAGARADLRGIYRLDGDELTLCYWYVTPQVDKRPQRFETKPNTGTATVLLRLSKQPDSPSSTQTSILFDGESFAGWNWRTAGSQLTLDDVWSIDAKQGVLRTKPGDGHGMLLTEQEFESFEMSLQWRLPAGGATSKDGVGLVVGWRGDQHVAIVINATENAHTWVHGYKAEPILGEFANAQRVANLNVRKLKQPGQWNTLQVKYSADELTVIENDVTIMHLKGLTLAKAPIAFRPQGTDMEFRRVEQGGAADVASSPPL